MTKKSIDLNKVVEIFKVIGHPNRLKILQILSSGEYHNVTEVVEECGLSQPATSDCLRMMQKCGLLVSEREGRAVYYRVADFEMVENLIGLVESIAQ